MFKMGVICIFKHLQLLEMPYETEWAHTFFVVAHQYWTDVVRLTANQYRLPKFCRYRKISEMKIFLYYISPTLVRKSPAGTEISLVSPIAALSAFCNGNNGSL
jgi:hypothetical protein